MTISNTTNRTNLAAGNGVTVNFTFSFKILAAANLKVWTIDADGVATLKTLSTHYTVAINTQTEGGTVTFLSAPASGLNVLIKRVLTYAQSTDFPTESNFPEESVEDTVDYLTMLSIQLKEESDRSIKLTDTSTVSGVTIEDPIANKLLVVDADGNIAMSESDFTDIEDELVTLAAISANIVTVAGISANVTTVAGISANVTTVAGISANVTTVAGISANVTTVAGISANVTTVAGIDTEVTIVAGISADIVIVAGIDTEITTVAGISAAVSTVAGIASAVSNVSSISAAVSTVSGISADVTTVAGISGNVTTVAGISANVTTVAGISANVTTVAGISANVTTVAGMSASIASVVANMTSINNAASFGFPTLTGSDVAKHLKVNAANNGYDLVAGANLNALAGLTGAADKIPYFTGAGAMDLVGRGWEQLSKTTISNVATIDFTDFVTGYDYMIRLKHYVPATNATELWLRTSANNGSSYDAGASDYAWGRDIVINNTTPSKVPGGDEVDSEIMIHDNLGNTGSDQVMDVDIILHDPVATEFTQITTKGQARNPNPQQLSFWGGGVRHSKATVTAARLLSSSGNMTSGIVSLFRIKL